MLFYQLGFSSNKKSHPLCLFIKILVTHFNFCDLKFDRGLICNYYFEPTLVKFFHQEIPLLEGLAQSLNKQVEDFGVATELILKMDYAMRFSIIARKSCKIATVNSATFVVH